MYVVELLTTHFFITLAKCRILNQFYHLFKKKVLLEKLSGNCWIPFFSHFPVYFCMATFFYRSAEILYSFMGMKGLKKETILRLFGLLVEARRWMNLFQHHDGITGTSKDEVMADYGMKFVNAMFIRKLMFIFMALSNREMIFNIVKAIFIIF